MIEFLYQYGSKPIDGTMHDYNGCGMHWETFNKKEVEVGGAPYQASLLKLAEMAREQGLCEPSSA